MGLLLEGLAGGMAAGADAMANGIHDEIRMAKQQAIDEARLRLQDDLSAKREIATESRKREMNVKDMDAIRTMSETNLSNAEIAKLGVGGEVDAESLQALKDNPQALEAYRKAGATGLLNSTRQQQAEADTSSALAIGRTDFADKFESVAKGERSDAKETSRHEESMRRLDLSEKNSQQRYLAQMAQNTRLAEAQEARLSKSESSAEVRAKVSAMTSALDSYKDIGEKAMLKMSSPGVIDNPELKKHYEDIANKSLADSNRIAKQLESYSFTGSFEVAKPVNKPTVALGDIFKDKPSPSAKPNKIPTAAAPPAKVVDKNRPVNAMWQKGTLNDVDKQQLNLGGYGLKRQLILNRSVKHKWVIAESLQPIFHFYGVVMAIVINQAQIDEARKAGYSDEEISLYLGNSHGLSDKVKSAFDNGYSGAEVIDYLSKAYAPPKIEVNNPERTLSGTLGDLGISALKSAVAVPETVVGIADLASGGAAGKLVENAGVRFKDTQNILDSYKSDAGQAAQDKFNNAEGFYDSAKAAIQNPSVIVNAGVESIAPMLAGGVVARGLLAAAPRLGLGASAAGEGIIGAGSQAESTRQQTIDGELTSKQSALSALSGFGTAAFGYAGGKLAGKLGIADVDTLAAGINSPEIKKSLVRKLAEGGISEGLFEELPQSAQEQILSNVALDKPWQDGVDKAMALGLLTGGAMGAGAQLMPRGNDASTISNGSEADDALAQGNKPSRIEELRAKSAEVRARQQASDNAVQNITNPNATIDDSIALAQTALDAPLADLSYLSNDAIASELNQVNQPSSDTDLLNQINAQFIPADDILGDSNVSDLPNDVPTTLADSATQSTSNQLSASVGDQLNNPAGDGSATTTSALSLGSDLPTGTEPSGNDAVVPQQQVADSSTVTVDTSTADRPFSTASDDFLPKMRSMTTDPKVIGQIDEELALRGITKPNSVTPYPNSVINSVDTSLQGSVDNVSTTLPSALDNNSNVDAINTSPERVDETQKNVQVDSAAPVVKESLTTEPAQLPNSVVADNATSEKSIIAKKYAEALAEGRDGVSPTPNEYHAKFADAIINKDAKALEHLSNGLNDTGKKVFTEVTGIKLPKTQSATWQVLRDWAGISNEQDAVDKAASKLNTHRKLLDKKVTENDFNTMDGFIKDGYREVKVIGGKNYLVNVNDNSKGINLSQHGSRMNQTIPYLKALAAHQNALDALELSKQAAPITSENGNTLEAAPVIAPASPTEKLKAQIKAARTKKAKTNTLLTTLRNIGGIAIADKLDVTGERKGFAPGGYNQIFKNDARQSLRGHIESGNLDEYLPHNIHLESQTQDSDAFDSTEAYDYLADKIRNGDHVLPYDVEQELKALKYEGDAVNDVADVLTDEAINEQLRQATNEERESATDARVFNTDSTNSGTESGAGREAAAQANASKQPEVAPQSNKDLLGEDTRNKQAIADAERAKDTKRNAGTDNQDAFNITGSNSEADKAAAAGAQDLFSAPIKQQSRTEASTGADVAENSSNQSSNSQAKDEVTKAKDALDAAGITGTDKLNTIAQVRQGNLTADEVASAHGAKTKLAEVPDYQGMRKELTKLGYPNSDLSRTERRVTINNNAVFPKDQFTIDIELKGGKWKVFEIGVPDSMTEEQFDAMTKFRNDLAILNQDEGAKPESKDKIQDFGAKIGGAKKDTYTRKLEESKSVDVSAEPLSKSWPEPDYQTLLDNGADAWAVAFNRAAREELPSKPSKKYALAAWVKSVNQLREVAYGLMDGSIAVDKAKEVLRHMQATSHSYGGIADRIELYQLVGHAQSLKGVSISYGEYSIRNGVEYKPYLKLWTVQKAVKASAMGNWPRELAEGKTKQEAMQAFKEAYAALTIQDAPQSKEASFEIYSYRENTGKAGFYIGKKVGRNHIDLANFATAAEARAYMREHNAELVAKLEKMKEIPNVRRDSNTPRVGEDMRNGQDVTPELFAESFGFKGVEFGNWVEGSKRQQDLNESFDALMDMAAILDIPPKAISLNGELSLAFGARGTGGIDAAKAHYEAGFIVINMTKKEGAGSLGHEWWHALDNYFSRMRNKSADFMTAPALDVSLSARNSNYHHKGEVRKEMVDAFGVVVRAINNTSLKARSSKLDAKRSKEYWSTGLEMSARAFETYLIAKIQDNNASNDYLANIVDEATWAASEKLGFELDASYPYPTAAEIPAIRAAFDNFFTVIESKDTDTGVALFSRSSKPRTPFVAQEHEGYLPALNKAVAMFKSGDRNKIQEAGNTPIPISRTPVVLRQVLEDDGSKPFKQSDFVVGKGSTLYLKANNIHSRSIHSGAIEQAVLDNLPQLIADPVAVFKSSVASDDSKSFKVLIDATDIKGNPIVVAIKPNVPMQQLNNAVVNLQATIFPTTWDDVKRWNKSGDLRYYNEKSPLIRGFEIPLASVAASNPREAVTNVSTQEGVDVNIGVTASKVKVISRGEVEALPQLAFSRNDPFFSLGTGTRLQLTKSKHQFGAKVLNKALVKYFGDDWSNSFESVDVPDTLFAYKQEVKVAFGTELRFVSPTNDDFDIFAGVQLPNSPNSIYVNARAETSLATIAGHEIYHTLERQRPDLHAWFKTQAKQYLKDFGAYHKNLNAKLKDGEIPYKSDVALSELLADFTGDALSDPVFLQQLANADGNKFKGLLNATIKFLNEAIAKLRDLKSSLYISDVEALRNDLRKALLAFSSGKQISEIDANNNDIRFSRNNVTKNIPDAIILNDLGAAKSNPDYDAAKQGDVGAAARLAKALITDEMIDKIKAMTDGNNLILGVTSIELSGKNAIPEAAALYIAEKLGIPYDENIVQSTSPKRTGMNGLDRIFNRPLFTGQVVDGAGYIFVDDTITQGGTFASLSSHIVDGGGNVVANIALTGKQYSSKIALTDALLQSVRQKFGDLEHEFKQATGYGYEGLTASEARYVTSGIPADKFRNRVIEESKKAAGSTVPQDIQSSSSLNQDPPKFSRNNPQASLEPEESIPAETKTQAAQRIIQDKFNRFKVLQDWLIKKGVDLSEAADVYLAETLMSGRVAARKENFREDFVAPLIKKTQEAGITMQQVGDFLKVQHAPEANERARELQGTSDATAYGVSDSEAKDAMREFKALPNFAELKSIANEWRLITDQTKKIKLESGLLTDEMVAAWEDTYDVYVPVKGGDEDSKVGLGKGLHVNGKTKQRLGHGLRDEAIIENILRDHEAAISLDEKNRVGKALIKFALEANNDDIVTIGKPVKRKVLKPGDSSYMVNYHGSDVAAFDSKQEAQAYISQAILKTGDVSGAKAGFEIVKTSDPVRVMLQASPMLADNEVNVYVAGHAVRIQINDEIAAREYKNMGVEHLNTILAVGREVNNWLSKAYTGYSPDFIFTNPIRDAIQGMITLTGNHGAGMAAKIFSNYPHAVKELIKHFKHKGSSSLVTEYRAMGGSTGGAYLSDLERIGNDIQSSYEEYQGALVTYQDTYKKAIDSGKSITAARTLAAMKAGMAGFKKLPIIGHFLSLMEHLNAVTENALRVATYKTLSESGMSKAKSAAQAKNLMNFNRKGEKSNAAGALYLFFNPSIQGTKLIQEALFTSEHKHQAQALAGSMALAAMTLSIMALSGDDDDKDRWNKTPDYVKDGNIVINLGGKQLTITLPYGYRMFWTLGNVMVDAQQGKDLGKLGVRLASSVFENMSPMGKPIDDMGNVNLFQILPTAPKMAVGTTDLVNQDSFGSPITPKKWKESMPDSQLMNRGTHGSLYDGIAEKLNSFSGGSKYEKGFVDVSPETLKFWVKSLTGGTGQFVLDSSNMIIQGAQGVTPQNVKDIPVVRRFVREAGVSDTMAAFWDRKNDADNAAEEIASARKAHDRDALMDLRDRKGVLASMANYSDRVLKMANAKRNAVTAIKASETLSLSEKVDRINALEAQENEVYDRFLNQFDRRINK